MLADCPNFQFHEGLGFGKEMLSVVVLSHSCDLAHEKLEMVQVCPYWSLEQVAARDGLWYFRSAGTVARQNIEGHDVSPTHVDFDADGEANVWAEAE